MATLIIPNEGELALTNRAFGKETNGDLTAKLFVNSVALDESTTAADFTECTATNYTSQAVSAASITVTQNGGTGKADAVFDANFVNMTASPDQTVYGVYVVDASNNLIGAATYDTSKVLSTESQTLNHTITISAG